MVGEEYFENLCSDRADVAQLLPESDLLRVVRLRGDRLGLVGLVHDLAASNEVLQKLVRELLFEVGLVRRCPDLLE